MMNRRFVDKFWAWSDHRGDLDNSFTKDELITNIMIYCVTQTMASAERIYFESQHGFPQPQSMTSFENSGPPASLRHRALSQRDQPPAPSLGRTQL